MKANDYFRYSFLIYKKTKGKSILCIVISFILSSISIAALFLCFSYKNNVSKLEEKYLYDNPFSFVVHDHYSVVLNEAKKYSPTAILACSREITLFDFDYSSFSLFSGSYPLANDLLAPINTGYQINQVVEVNGVEYTITGLYESNDYEGFIGSLSSLFGEVDIYGVSIYYDREESYTKLNQIARLTKAFQSKSISINTIDYDKFMSNHGYALIIEAVCLGVGIVLFFSTIGFYLNALAMSLDCNRNLFAVLSASGLSKGGVSLIQSIYGLSLSTIGSLAAYGLISLIFCFINFNTLFCNIIPPILINELNSFTFNSLQYWYILLIMQFLFGICIGLKSAIFSHRVINKDLYKYED